MISLPNGHANFTDRETPFNNSVPLFCNSGYDLDGEDEATCGHDGSWSFQTTCQIKGNAQTLSLHLQVSESSAVVQFYNV